MTEIDPKVLGEQEDGRVATPATPPSDGVAKPATPVQAPSDAEVQTLKEKYDAEIKRREQDLNKMKSTFQSQDAQRQREWWERQQKYEQEIERLRLSHMDDDQRKAYESEKESMRVEELETTLAELEQQNQEVQAMFTAQQYFLEKGVPPSALTTTEGYEALWNSGMDWIMQEFERLRSGPQTKVIPPVVPPTAPAVDTKTGLPPAGPTWADLVARFGSEEAVFQAIEERRISGDILPK